VKIESNEEIETPFEFTIERNTSVISSGKAGKSGRIAIAYRPDKFNEKFDKYVVQEYDQKKRFMII
jgi:hypothetical protein